MLYDAMTPKRPQSLGGDSPNSDNEAKKLFKLTDATRARADAAEVKSKLQVGFGPKGCFHGDENGYANGLSSWHVPIWVFSVNIWGLRSYSKSKGLFNFFKQKSYVIGLQRDIKRNGEGGELYFCAHTSHSAGQVILFKKGLPCSIQVEYESQRILVVKVDMDGKILAIVNAYAPNTTKEKLSFLKTLLMW